MNSQSAPIRYRAVAMELSVHLDERRVEMHILTDMDGTVTVVCDRDSIFSIQRHIEQIASACPEILTWTSPGTSPVTSLEKKDFDNQNGGNPWSYESAMWEGWPSPRDGLHRL